CLGKPDADRGGYTRRARLDSVGRDRLADALRDDCGLLSRAPGKQRDEFLAAVTPKKVSGAQSLACCPSDSLEDLITHLVSGGIIDQLEAVDVEQHHRERQTVALCYGPLVCGHLKKVTPIVQACQAVGACHQLLACERLTKLTI